MDAPNGGEILEKHIKNHEISALLKGAMKGFPVYEIFDFPVCFRMNTPSNVVWI